MKKRCAHRTVQEFVFRRESDVIRGGRDLIVKFTRFLNDDVDARFCSDCLTHLPLGPSRDDGEYERHVACEVRAAELAAAWDADNGVIGVATDAECFGWQLWPYGHPKSWPQYAGWLALQIRMHDSDTNYNVNWAGAEHAAKLDAQNYCDDGPHCGCDLHSFNPTNAARYDE